MLQGWFAVLHPDRTVPCVEVEETLSTFAPPGWCLHIECLPREGQNFVLQQGQAGYASFVPMPEVHTEAEIVSPAREQAESDIGTDDAVVVLPEGAADVADPDPATPPSRTRSRSPRRPDPPPHARTPVTIPTAPEVSNLPTEDPGPNQVQVSAMLLTMEYMPEVLQVRLTPGCSVPDALATISAARGRISSLRFPRLLEARPQPTMDYIVCVATPLWARDVFVVVDTLRLNGTLCCTTVRPVADRAALLSIAGLPSSLDVEVYVPDRPTPLSGNQVAVLSTGDCISIVPAATPVFTVACLADRIQDRQGWCLLTAPPTLEGYWVLLLTDEGQQRLCLPPQRRRFMRGDIVRLLELQDTEHFMQPVRLPPDDAYDFGIAAQEVVIVDTSPRPEPPEEPAGTQHRSLVRYCLDLRPVTCGLTWHRAWGGLVSSRAISQRASEYCPSGHYTVVIGGTPLACRDGLDLRVDPGEVIAVEFVRGPEPESSGSMHPADSSSSDSSSDTETEDDDPDSPRSNRDPLTRPVALGFRKMCRYAT
ncbi:unnamed protein product [Symbiodinium sp. CCMP2592]|nr:unnamed protein product [Symbiodinium sp. CCMP2592]